MRTLPPRLRKEFFQGTINVFWLALFLCKDGYLWRLIADYLLRLMPMRISVMRATKRDYHPKRRRLDFELYMALRSHEPMADIGISKAPPPLFLAMLHTSILPRIMCP